MKRLAYVSTLKGDASGKAVSRDVLGIVNAARVANKALNITGVLVVSGNTVFQFLEGDAQTVATLYYKISRDDRHTHVSVVLNSVAEQRLFPDWSMRFCAKGNVSFTQTINTIRNELGNELSFQSLADRRRYVEAVGDTQSRAAIRTNNTTAVSQNPVQSLKSRYQQGLFGLTAWPKPSRVRLSGDLISLCSSLVGARKSYQELLTAGVCRSEATLVSHLQLLDQEGLLVLASASPSQMPRRKAPNTSDRFSSVLKRFIAASRAS